MKLFIQIALAALVFVMAELKSSNPKIRVHSRDPGIHGKNNILICEASEFQPPSIDIELMRGDELMTGYTLTDLVFKETWQFHITKSANFTPEAGDEFSCRVIFSGKMKKVMWENDM